MTPASFTNSAEDRLRRSFSVGLGLFFVALFLVLFVVGFLVPPEAGAAEGMRLSTFFRLLGGIPLALGLLHAPLGIYLYRRNKQRLARFAALRASAVPGQVRLVRVEQLHPDESAVLVRLHLEVHLPARAAYALSVEEWVPPAHLARLRPEERLPVHVSRDAPDILFIDWGGKVPDVEHAARAATGAWR